MQDFVHQQYLWHVFFINTNYWDVPGRKPPKRVDGLDEQLLDLPISCEECWFLIFLFFLARVLCIMCKRCEQGLTIISYPCGIYWNSEILHSAILLDSFLMLLRAGWVMYTSFSPSGSSFCILWRGICIGGILLRRSSFDFHLVVEDGLVTKSRNSIRYLTEKTRT